jgi:hypothetical protein
MFLKFENQKFECLKILLFQSNFSFNLESLMIGSRFESILIHLIF